MSNLNAPYTALRQPFKRKITDVFSSDGSLHSTEQCGKLPCFGQGLQSCWQFKESRSHLKSSRQQQLLPGVKQQQLQQRTQASAAMLMIVNHLQHSRTQAGMPVSLEEIETAAKMIHQQKKKDAVVIRSNNRPCGQQTQQQQPPEAALDAIAPVQLLNTSMFADWSAAAAAAMVPMPVGLLSYQQPAPSFAPAAAPLPGQAMGGFFPGPPTSSFEATNVQMQGASAAGAAPPMFSSSPAQSPLQYAVSLEEDATRATEQSLNSCQLPAAAEVVNTAPTASQCGPFQQLLLDSGLQPQQPSSWKQHSLDSHPGHGPGDAALSSFTTTRSSELSGSEVTLETLALFGPQCTTHQATAAAAGDDDRLRGAMVARKNSVTSVSGGAAHSNSSSSGNLQIFGDSNAVAGVATPTAAAAAAAGSNGASNALSWDDSPMEDWVCGRDCYSFGQTGQQAEDWLLLLGPGKELQSKPPGAGLSTAAAALSGRAGVADSDALMAGLQNWVDLDAAEEDLIIAEDVAVQHQMRTQSS